MLDNISSSCTVMIASRGYDLQVTQEFVILCNVINLSLRKPMQTQGFTLSVDQDFQFLFRILTFEQCLLRYGTGLGSF